MDSSLRLLKDFVRQIHDNVPEVTRCEMHGHLIEGQDYTVHLLLRFTDEDGLQNFVVDEVDFQVWLARKEDEGCWTCCMYHMGFTLLAEFDRERSERTILPSRSHAKSRRTDLPPKPMPDRKIAASSISNVAGKQKAKGEAMAKQSVTPSIAPHGRRGDIEMQEIPVTEAKVSREEMSEVRQGKERVR